MSDTPRTLSAEVFAVKTWEENRKEGWPNYPPQGFDLAAMLERELAGAKEEIEKLNAISMILRYESNKAQRTASELLDERDSLRVSLAELRKVADDLGLLVTSLTRNEMQYRPEVKALSEWKVRNP